MRFKLLPLTLGVASVFFTVKVADVMNGTDLLSYVSVADAQEGKEPAPKKEIPAPAAEEKPAEKPAEAAAEKPAEKAAEKTEEKPAEKTAEKPGEKPGEKPAEKAGEEKKSDKPAERIEGQPANVTRTPGPTVDYRFTSSEMDLLKNLAKRREELDRWEASVQIKESALDATEKRINEKITKIETMKQEVAQLLAAYNTQEDAKVRSLVKIYESMKPKDAARIFDEIEMPVLLLVIDKMAEKKAAPILAEMDSKKAKQVTVELAAQRRSYNNKVSAAGNAAGIPTNGRPAVPAPTPAPASAAPAAAPATPAAKP